jgi:hypothetical protein
MHLDPILIHNESRKSASPKITSVSWCPHNFLVTLRSVDDRNQEQLYTETPRTKNKHKKEPGHEGPTAKSKQETDSLVTLTRPSNRIKRPEFACIRPLRLRRHRRYRLVRSTWKQESTCHKTAQRLYPLERGYE